MVKELEDSPRDSVAVLLDCDPAGLRRATPPDSSFDAAVRAAGSVLRAPRRPRKAATLVTTGRARRRAAGLLARRRLRGLRSTCSRRPSRTRSTASRAGSERADARRSMRASSSSSPRTWTPAALEALLGSRRRGASSVVWVDAPSYAGRPTRAATGPLRLAAAGIPVAVVRHGDDLGAALDLSASRRSAHG